MMVKGSKMDLIYCDLYQATWFEKFIIAYEQFLKANGERSPLLGKGLLQWMMY